MLRAWVCGVCLAAGVLAVHGGADADVPQSRLGVSVGAGTSLLGDDSISSVGAEPEAGYRLGPVLAMARIGVMRVSIQGDDPDPNADTVDGTMYQYGLSARVPFHTLTIGSGGGFEMWAEGGWLRRSIYWDDLGVLRRDGITAAIGFDGVGPLGDGPRPHRITFGLALRAGWHAPVADDDAYDPSMEMLIRVGWQR